jgi:NADPH-dependent 2,4-dienoyl-CoA reductase/sulfur reductase-like enzyme
MSDVMKVVIIGGVAAGPKVASRIIRLVPDAEVTIVEKGKLLSYAGCGLPLRTSMRPAIAWNAWTCSRASPALCR